MKSKRNKHKLIFILARSYLFLLMSLLIVYFFILLFSTMTITINIMLVFAFFFIAYYCFKYLKYVDSPNKKQIFLAYAINMLFIVSIFR